jgi:hypothetical protein
MGHYPQPALLTLLCIAFLSPVAAQQAVDPSTTSTTLTATPVRDSQALAILAQTANAAGGANTIAAIQDFVGTGLITYFSADQEVQGSVTVKGMGANSFRLDASLPSGTRSWAVDAEQGFIKEEDGTIRSLSPGNALTLAAFTFPYLKIISALSDSSVTVQNLGLVQLNGRAAYQVQTQKNFPIATDPGSELSRLSAQTLFIDSLTFQIIEVRDFIEDANRSTDSYAHEMDFSDYREVDGLLLPFSITETIGSQQTLAIQFSSFAFNSGLTDGDFQP